MTQETARAVEALVGSARGGFQCQNPDCGEWHEYPVDDVFEWACWAPHKRYEWATLAALRAGDTAEAQVFATLRQAAVLELQEAHVDD